MKKKTKKQSKFESECKSGVVRTILKNLTQEMTLDCSQTVCTKGLELILSELTRPKLGPDGNKKLRDILQAVYEAGAQFVFDHLDRLCLASLAQAYFEGDIELSVIEKLFDLESDK